MVKTQVIEQKPNSLFIKADALSQLAFLNLSTICSISNHQRTPNDTLYFHDTFENRREYFEITDELKRLAKAAEAEELLPFSTMQVVEFTIPKSYLELMINKLSQHPLEELQDLAKSLSESTNTELSYPKPQNIINSQTNINYNPTQVSLLDIDRSIENKIIFYHLYQANNDEVEKISEKIELMTIEQKENFIEQIFQRSPLQKLPKIIYNHTFCTLKIICPFHELKPLSLISDIKLVFQKPGHFLGYSTPESILNTEHHQPYLSLMEKIKAHFEQTPNPYILPETFNQQAVIALDLQSIEELKKINNPLKIKIFEEITKHEPFIKTLINN